MILYIYRRGKSGACSRVMA